MTQKALKFLGDQIDFHYYKEHLTKDITVSWEGDEIEASDIERFKALNKNSGI